MFCVVLVYTMFIYLFGNPTELRTYDYTGDYMLYCSYMYPNYRLAHH